MQRACQGAGRKSGVRGGVLIHIGAAGNSRGQVQRACRAGGAAGWCSFPHEVALLSTYVQPDRAGVPVQGAGTLGT